MSPQRQHTTPPTTALWPPHTLRIPQLLPVHHAIPITVGIAEKCVPHIRIRFKGGSKGTQVRRGGGDGCQCGDGRGGGGGHVTTGVATTTPTPTPTPTTTTTTSTAGVCVCVLSRVRVADGSPRYSVAGHVAAVGDQRSERWVCGCEGDEGVGVGGGGGGG